jgi:hypothetical protein
MPDQRPSRTVAEQPEGRGASLARAQTDAAAGSSAGVLQMGVLTGCSLTRGKAQFHGAQGVTVSILEGK